jgi:hypothetical protein
MKSRPFVSIFAALFAALTSVSFTAAVEPASVRPLYVTIDTTNPAGFDRGRNSSVTGQELILATLKDKAAEEARLAHFEQPITVLDIGVKPPAGAQVLRLTFMGNVTADYFDGQESKSNYLGVVSNTSLSFHPNYRAMQNDIRAHTMPDEHRDALLRANVEMYLYTALDRLAHSLPAAKR